MGAISKVIGGVAGIIIAIIILAVIVPAQFQQQQVLNQKVDQDKSQLNNDAIKLINDCDTVLTSVGDLTGCKSTIDDIKNKCQDGEYSSMSVCDDPQIGHFFSTVDGKILYAEGVMSNSGSKLVDDCVDLVALTGNNQECILDMQSIQQTCNQYNIDNHMAVCSDPRINEILSGSIHSQLPVTTIPNPNQINQNGSSLIQSANQYTLSIIDSCVKATDPSAIQYCSETAQKILNYCNHVSSVGVEQICNDPRLQQLINMKQATNQTAPLNNASQSAINATALNNLNNQMQDLLNECSNSTISGGSTCANAINTIKQECAGNLRPYLSYFPVCNDPRLQQVPTGNNSFGQLITDRPSYQNSGGATTVKISGKLDSFTSPASVTLVITYPNGSTKDNAQVNVNNDGTFSYDYILGPTSPTGTYNIQAYYNNSEVSQTSFSFN